MAKSDSIVSFADVEKAYTRIQKHIFKTPALYSPYLSILNEGRVYLKLENEQLTGSFKIRGALNKIFSLNDEELNKGIVTASTGNHGLAVATASKIAGVNNGLIFVPNHASSGKLKLIEQAGGVIQKYGNNSLETEEFAKAYASKNNLTWISPYNDADVIAGQGTIGLELADQIPDLQSVLATIGGGGLMSGIATALKTKLRDVNIGGCLPENSPEIYKAVRENRFVEPVNLPTLSDGSAGGYEEGAITLEIIRELVDQYFLVSESEIKSAIRLVFDNHHKVMEGAAGVSVAAFIKNAKSFQNQTVCIVVCGANISASLFKDVLSE